MSNKPDLHAEVRERILATGNDPTHFDNHPLITVGKKEPPKMSLNMLSTYWVIRVATLDINDPVPRASLLGAKQNGSWLSRFDKHVTPLLKSGVLYGGNVYVEASKS